MNEMKKLRIDFQKLINGGYDTEEMLLIYQWLIPMGKSCNKQYGWNRYGLHQSFHGYSYNNERNEIFPLHVDFIDVVKQGFVNLLCKTNQPTIVKEFLSENRIGIGKIRVIEIHTHANGEYYKDIVNGWDGLRGLLNHITTAYKGLLLKKELFHPDLDDHVNPRIIDNISFGTNDNKWYAWFTFSFENFNYEPGWKHNFSQKQDESIYSFFDRVVEEMEGLIVHSDDCTNCQWWTENAHSGEVLRHGYRGFCKSYHGCKRPDVKKYKWWSENGKVVDNALHYSIVHPYIKERK